MSRVRHKLGENPPSAYTKVGDRGQWVALTLVALVAYGVYVNALGNELVYDDRKLIPANELMHDPWRVDRILGGRYWGEVLHSHHYRPLTVWTLAFNYWANDLNSTRKCNLLGSWHRNGQLVYFPWPFQTQLPTEALMGTYHQLTECQRYQIYALKKAGHDQQSIATTLEVSPSTICRELRRNQGPRGYRPHQAHQHAWARRRAKAKATKMTPAVIKRIEADLRQEWSPEQIAGRLQATDGLRLSAERIYQHIRADRQAGGTLYRHLRHSQKKRKKRYGKADTRGQIKDRVSIDQRPAIVEEKSRIGDGEIDLVLGSRGTGVLVSVVERRSRYTVLGKVCSKQAEPVAAATIALLAPYKEHTQTITADNGKEFAHHATISQALDAAVYFAHPYHAWERGLNENTNGLIRQYVPKGTALDTLSDEQVHHIMDRLNHRPRKGLAFQTPHEILCKETGIQPKHFKIALTS